MGLLQKACETYDAMAGRVGIMYEKEKEPLAPISHMMARPQIKITLDQNGNFITAQALEKDVPKIIIPATEESAGRTVKAAELPHPLCDYLRYLLPGIPSLSILSSLLLIRRTWPRTSTSAIRQRSDLCRTVP